MENNCYVTLMTTEDFLPCVIRNAWALEYFNSKYPYIVMIPQGNSYLKEQLELNNIQYREIEVLKFDENDLDNYFNDTINKFQILTFTEYDKILFLDADILIINNLDDEFDKLNNDIYLYGNNINIDAQNLLCKPNINLYQNIINEIQLNKYFADEEVLKKFYPNPSEYHSVRYNDMLHFRGSLKPWLNNNINNLYLNYLFTKTSKEEFFNQLNNNKNKIINQFLLFNEIITKKDYLQYCYITILNNQKDIDKFKILNKKLKNLGHRIFLIALINEKSNIDLNKIKNFPFRIIKNSEKINKNFLQKEFLNYLKICLIKNLDINLEDNLDCLFSNDLNINIKNKLLNKYNNDIELFNNYDLQGFLLKENNCYITLMTTEDFLPCVKRCNQALKYFNSKYPYIVMIPKGNEYLKEQLELNNIQYREIEVLKFDENNLDSYFNDTINKFQIFTFTEFDKILFLDADILITGNPDYLFDTLKEDQPIILYENGSGGSLITKPNNILYEHIMLKIKEKKYYEDGSVLQDLFYEYKIDFKPNELYFHFNSGPIKPWNKFSKNYNYLKKIFFDDNHFYYVLNNIKELYGYFYEWEQNLYNNLNENIYIFVILNNEDIYKSINLRKKMMQNGSNYSFIAVTTKDLNIDKLNYYEMPYRIINFNKYNLLNIIISIINNFKDLYNKACIIFNLDLKINENLDIIFNSNLLKEIKQNLLYKYTNDLILIQFNKEKKFI